MTILPYQHFANAILKKHSLLRFTFNSCLHVTYFILLSNAASPSHALIALVYAYICTVHDIIYVYVPYICHMYW